jgi:predicted DNA-binding transcriptional regulator AlpA
MTQTAPAPQAPSPFLTEAQAATRLSLAPKTLRNWRSTGVGPSPLKLGSAVRYHQDALDTWALAQVTVAVA